MKVSEKRSAPATGRSPGDRGTSIDGPRPRPASRGANPAIPVVKEAGQLDVAGAAAMERATPEAIRNELAFLPSHFEVLDQISSGIPVPGATNAIAAARLRLDFLLSKPAQGVAVQGHFTVAINDPYAPPGSPPVLMQCGPAPELPPRRPGEGANDYADRIETAREAAARCARVVEP